MESLEGSYFRIKCSKQCYTFQESEQKKEDLVKSNVAFCLQRHVYNSFMLPGMTYVANTWTLTKQAHVKFAVADNKIENKYAQYHIQGQLKDIWVR